MEKRVNINVGGNSNALPPSSKNKNPYEGGYNEFLKFWEKINNMQPKIVAVRFGQLTDERNEFIVMFQITEIKDYKRENFEDPTVYYGEYDDNGVHFTFIAKVIKTMPDSVYKRLKAEYDEKRLKKGNAAAEKLWERKSTAYFRDLYERISDFLFEHGFTASLLMSDEYDQTFVKEDEETEEEQWGN